MSKKIYYFQEKLRIIEIMVTKIKNTPILNQKNIKFLNRYFCMSPNHELFLILIYK